MRRHRGSASGAPPLAGARRARCRGFAPRRASGRTERRGQAADPLRRGGAEPVDRPASRPAADVRDRRHAGPELLRSIGGGGTPHGIALSGRRADRGPGTERDGRPLRAPTPERAGLAVPGPCPRPSVRMARPVRFDAGKQTGVDGKAGSRAGHGRRFAPKAPR